MCGHFLGFGMYFGHFKGLGVFSSGNFLGFEGILVIF